MAELRAAGSVQNKFVLLVRSRPCANRGWAGGSTRPDCLFRRDVPHGARGGWGRRRLVLFRGDPAGPATRGPGLTLTQGKRPPTPTSPLISTGKPGPSERAGARAQQKRGPASPAGSSRAQLQSPQPVPGREGTDVHPGQSPSTTCHAVSAQPEADCPLCSQGAGAGPLGPAGAQAAAAPRPQAASACLARATFSSG